MLVQRTNWKFWKQNKDLTASCHAQCYRKSEFYSSVCIWNSRHTGKQKKKNAFRTFFLSLYLPVAHNWEGEWGERWGLSLKFPVSGWERLQAQRELVCADFQPQDVGQNPLEACPDVHLKAFYYSRALVAFGIENISKGFSSVSPACGWRTLLLYSCGTLIEFLCLIICKCQAVRSIWARRASASILVFILHVLYVCDCFDSIFTSVNGSEWK